MKMIACSSCKAQIDPDSIFCKFCGVKINSSSQQCSHLLFPFRDDKYYHYVNNDMVVLIPAKYDFAFPFQGKYACVSSDNLWGCIDRDGKFIIPAIYEYPFFFNDNLTKVKKPGRGWAFINNMASEIANCDYVDAGNFHEGRAKVHSEEQGWGFINRFGTLTVPTIYREVIDFVDGLSKVNKNGLWGFINRFNEVVIPIKYHSLGDFSEGLCWFCNCDEVEFLDGFFDEDGEEQTFMRKFDFLTYGFINMTGIEVIPEKFTAVGSFKEGLACFSKAGNFNEFADNDAESDWGYINASGEVVISDIYQSASAFQDGVASVRKGGMYALINRLGLPITEFKYSHIGSFNNGMASAAIGVNLGYLDIRGHETVTFRFDTGSDFEQDGLCIISIDGKRGMVNRLNELVIPLKYDGLMPFSEGLAAFKLDNKWGFLNYNSEIVIRPLYDNVGYFKNGVVEVRYCTEWAFGIIPESGYLPHHLYDFDMSKEYFSSDIPYEPMLGYLNPRGIEFWKGDIERFSDEFDFEDYPF